MSYQVIARKYRPKSFDQLIGQNHITQTIHNSIKLNRLAHALLFTGLRGTGKTSSARILAKTLRCTEISNDLVPCDKCQNCIEISQSRSIDVLEIDGASNNGVDAIRDLRENVMFAPSSGKYKIFIIDEVHMLSTSAFNALLKTLEEPPAHVIFILATTEAHKIPQTILSRCQRFDFRRISLKVVAEYLKTICDLESIKAESAALWLIAKQGEGSMRDSLSLLDQVISFSQGELSESRVSQVLGLTERTLVFEVFNAILNREPKLIIPLIEKILKSGQNEKLFLEDLSKLVRHALLLKIDNTLTDSIDLPEDEIKTLIEKIKSVSDADLHMLFDMLLKSIQDVARSHDSQIVFEICLVRMVQAPRIQELRSLLNGSVSITPTVTTTLSEKKKPELNIEASIKASDLPKETVPEPTRLSEITSTENWLEFVNQVKKEDAFFAAKIENLLFIKSEGKRLTLQAPQNLAFLATQLQDSETKKKFQGYIDSALGGGYTFEVLKSSAMAQGDSAQSLAAKKQIQADDEKLAKWNADPRIQMAKNVFKAEIKLVKPE